MKKNRGFTLLELLIVIAIIGVLAGVVLISYPLAAKKARLANAMRFADNIRGSLQQDMVAWWKFDEGSGTVAKDTWLNQQDGTLFGSPVWVEGIVNGALAFDGVDDYVRIPDNDFLDTNSSFTLSIWFYNKAGAKAYPTLLNRASQNAANGYFWIFTTGTNEADLAFQWANGATRSEIFTSVLGKDTWQHILFTFNNTTKALECYVDGKKQSTTRTLTGYLPVDDGVLYIGTYGGSLTSYPVYGYIDEVRIFSEALPQTAIQKYYAQGLKAHSNLAIISNSVK